MKNSKILICAILCVFTLSSCNVSATHPHNDVAQTHEQTHEHEHEHYKSDKPWPYFWYFYGIAFASLSVVVYAATALK